MFLTNKNQGHKHNTKASGWWVSCARDKGVLYFLSWAIPSLVVLFCFVCLVCCFENDLSGRIICPGQTYQYSPLPIQKYRFTSRTYVCWRTGSPYQLGLILTLKYDCVKAQHNRILRVSISPNWFGLPVLLHIQALGLHALATTEEREPQECRRDGQKGRATKKAKSAQLQTTQDSSQAKQKQKKTTNKIKTTGAPQAATPKPNTYQHPPPQKKKINK